MSDLQVFDFVVETLLTITSRPEILRTDHFIRDLALDSLDVMDTLAQIEDKYGLIIPTDILPRLVTVDDLVKEVEQRIHTMHPKTAEALT